MGFAREYQICYQHYEGFKNIFYISMFFLGESAIIPSRGKRKSVQLDMHKLKEQREITRWFHVYPPYLMYIIDG